MTVQHVSEFPATAPEQIEFFARLLSNSEHRRKVFVEVYRGQSKKPKTAKEIGSHVGLPAKRVLEIAGFLAANNLFEQTKHQSRTAYKKYKNINTAKKKILRLATSKKQLDAHVTVRNPNRPILRIELTPSSRDLKVDVKHVTVEDIDNFARVRSLEPNRLPAKLRPARLPEDTFKNGVAAVLGNRGEFKDWGGEKNDLFSTHVKIGGKRRAAAFGFKGPGAKGTLTPAKMGKNGDQIQRLFSSPAEAFVVQYEGQIAESVLEQMQQLAVARSAQLGGRVYYGVIALEDSYRLRLGYPKEFAFPD